jgi:hypothetical protein
MLYCCMKASNKSNSQICNLQTSLCVITFLFVIAKYKCTVSHAHYVRVLIA